MAALATKAFQPTDQIASANMLAEGLDVHLQKPGDLLCPQRRMIGEGSLDRTWRLGRAG